MEISMRTDAAVVALVAVVLSMACAAPPAGTDPVERDRLDQRQREFFAAMAAKDADTVAELFSEAAVLHIANMPPIEGRPAIRRFYGNMFGFLSASTATPETLHVSAGGDLAYGVGSTSNEFRGPEGVVEYTGKYFLVWRKLAGDWMIVLYGVSSNQPAAPR
jgi:ketosteroid isomerase-like protein